MPEPLDVVAARTTSLTNTTTTSQNPSVIQETTDAEKQESNHQVPGAKAKRFKIDSKVIYDAILGLSDGLTVPFALTAGLTAVGSTQIIILGGLAELVAGAISMGLGGFVGSKSEFEAYQTAERRCDDMMSTELHIVRDIIDEHFSAYGLDEETRQKIIDALISSSRDQTKMFLMKHHFSLEKPDTKRPYTSATTLGVSYFLGGFMALIPYFCVRKNQVYTGLWWSIGIMGVVMLIFGYVKTCVVRGWSGRDNVLAGVKGAIQMLVIGALAVGAAVGLVRAIQSETSL